MTRGTPVDTVDTAGGIIPELGDNRRRYLSESLSLGCEIYASKIESDGESGLETLSEDTFLRHNHPFVLIALGIVR